MNELPKENIYGHAKRLQWLIDSLGKKEIIVDLGCGTGRMISLPLTKLGYCVYGLDIDEESISIGRQLFQREGLNLENLMTIDLSELNLVPDVVIASEVLEHVQDKDLINILSTIRQKLKLGGLLLVTVPNGYGWFEMESFVWFKTGIGRLLQSIRIVSLINKFKCLLFGKDIESLFPSTLSKSSHRQRFTYHAIIKLLEDNGFEVIGAEGSVLFAGPFSNLFFTGIRPIMKINSTLGDWFPRLASGFYVGCRLRTR